MHIKLPFEAHKPIAGEASVDIDKAVDQVFAYVGEHFFDNYPKWANEVIEFEPLDGNEVFVGAKAKQIRKDNDAEVESVFAITEYQPKTRLTFQGLTEPYKHCYVLEASQADCDQPTRLTFRFEFLELELFMRPFEKLIRCAIEDGAETTVENIRNLILLDCN